MKSKPITVAIMILLLVTACTTGNVVQEKRVKIGVMAPMTGSVATYGEYVSRGLTLAQEELAAKGWDVTFNYGDTQADPSTAVTEMSRLTRNVKVSAVIGAVASGATLAAAPIAEETHTVLLSPISTAAAITDAGDYVFRITAKDDQQATDLAQYAHEQGYTNAAILYLNNDWGVGLEKNFKKAFPEIVADETMAPETKDVRAQLLKIKQAHPDVLFVPCTLSECATTLQQLQELDISIPVLSADVFHNQDILDAVGDAADDVVYTYPANPSGEAWQSFRAKFKERYGEEPTINSALAYDALYAIYYAVDDKTEFTGEELKNNLYKIDFTGPSGHNVFDENGDVDKSFSFGTVRNGQFVQLE